MREWIELRLKEPDNGQAVLISNGGIITAAKFSNSCGLNNSCGCYEKIGLDYK